MRRFLINTFFEDEEDYKDWIIEYNLDFWLPISIFCLLTYILIMF